LVVLVLIELDYQSIPYYCRVKEKKMPAYKTGVRGRPKKTFAYMIKSRRVTRGYSQRQLAALLGIDHTYVSHWENGRRCPNVGILHDLVEVLEYNDKEVRWLLRTLAEGKV
jgi:DNA-binding transcriptional regulator YiaG